MHLKLVRRVFVMAQLAALFASAGAVRAADAGDVRALLDRQEPLVIAHRGFSALAPENTLTSFRFAVAAGADLVELDYHLSRDGVPVVIHDGTLDRCTDARTLWGGKDLQVSDYDLADLRKVNASVPRAGFAPESVPTLEEALGVIQPGAITLIERKGGDAASCVALLQRESLINRVVVQSFDWDYLREFHQLAPEQLLGALGPIWSWEGREIPDSEKDLSAEWLDRIESVGARVAVWNNRVSAAAVSEAHARGMDVWVYTIDDPAEANRLLDMGVDGIITNNTSLLWKTLAQRAAAKAE